MLVGVPLEPDPAECRVALVPAVAAALGKARLEMLVQEGAGERAGFADASYAAQGAKLSADRRQLFSQADVIVYVHGPKSPDQAVHPDLELLRPGQIVVGLLDPLGSPRSAKELAARRVTAFALELLPRSSRAQPMDALTSLATVAGYKAVLLAAARLPRLLPLMMTAAGTITPARVLVVGAGVAGLQAIATARRLGAVVEAYDVRPAVKEEVESLGAKFLELKLEATKAVDAGGYARAMDEAFLRRQRELLSAAVADSDIVIATAAVPGKPAPRLIDEASVSKMRPGAIIVDLAAETGGNCEVTVPGQTVVKHGVTIVGAVRLAATVPQHASQMYARNLTAFLVHLMKDGGLDLNRNDEIIRDTLVTHDGQVVQPRVLELLGSGWQNPQLA
jgi:NAD(P) transhydrogenase subunit alpha